MSPARKSAHRGAAPRRDWPRRDPIGSSASERRYRGDPSKPDGQTRCAMEESPLYAGIDWAESSHVVCLLEGDRRQFRTFAHCARGLDELVAWLLEQAKGNCLALAIEVPHGPVVDALMAAGIAIFAINPKQLDRFRDRFTVAGAKDDQRDAEVLACSLRTDPHAFRRVDVHTPQWQQLREALRILDDLSEQLRALSNQLRQQIWRIRPELLELSPAADEHWVWELLAAAPTARRLAALSSARLGRILKTAGVRRYRAEDVLPVLRNPQLLMAPGVEEAVAYRIHTLVPQLRLMADQRRQTERLIAELLDSLPAAERGEHRDADVIRSMPGIGTWVCATMLAEAAEPLKRRDYHALRAQSGAAPVTRRSGKTVFVAMRRACNPRLRKAVMAWARTASRCEPRARAIYQRHRDVGHSWARSMRAVANSQLRLLVAALKSGSLYSPCPQARPANAA
jgi:transposase/transposase IS116/IS110/IS902 family protein